MTDPPADRPLDDWLAGWRKPGSGLASRSEVQSLVDEIDRLRGELAEKWELWRSCTGAEVYAELTPRIDKLYMQPTSTYRPDRNRPTPTSRCSPAPNTSHG